MLWKLKTNLHLSTAAIHNHAIMTLTMQLEMKRVLRRLPGRRLALMDEIRGWDLPPAEETP